MPLLPLSFRDSGFTRTGSSGDNFYIIHTSKKRDEPVIQDEDEKRINLLTTYLVDVPLFITILGVCIAIDRGAIKNIYKFGFMCYDDKYGTDSHRGLNELVGFIHVYPSVLILPPIALFISEWFFAKDAKHACRKMFWMYKYYAIGLLLNYFCVMFMQILVGSLRPDFMSACSPDHTPSCKIGRWISEFTCHTRLVRGPDKYIEDYWSFRSFPSVHASLTCHCGYFLFIYLQIRGFDWKNRSVFLVPFLQLVITLICIYVSLAKIADIRAFWYDVVAGNLLAVPTTYLSVHLCSNFSPLINDSLDFQNDFSQKPLVFDTAPS